MTFGVHKSAVESRYEVMVETTDSANKLRHIYQSCLGSDHRYSWADPISKHLKSINMCLVQGTAPWANLLKKSSTKSLMVSAANCLAARCERLTKVVGRLTKVVLLKPKCKLVQEDFFLAAKLRFDALKGFPTATPCFHRLALPPCRGWHPYHN